MVLNPDDNPESWTLPGSNPLDGPDLNIGELLLIDWVLTPGSGLYPGTATGVSDLGEIKSQWAELRKDLWQRIAVLDKEVSSIQNKTDRDMALMEATRHLALSQDDAEILLTLTPTTWHWSNSPEDYGFMLCMKLAAYLRGEVWTYEIPKPAEQANTPTTPPSDD